ncbi:MAG: 50S ribosomal protein L11 methyltransferase [Desulfobacterales bacterium]|nr:50S ribosomal protein L11 methyltransferase [Desulfobacterales bacterium]
MKWIAAKIIFDFDEKQLATDLISNIFYEIGVKGVVVEDPDLVPIEGWGDSVERKPNQHSVTGYIPKNQQGIKSIQNLKKKLKQLEKKNRIFSKIFYREIAEEDWAESWKTYFQPIKISEKIVVKPTWREYKPHQDEIVIKIDPGMAFGTGTHPTTYMCINLIEKYLKTGDSFMDVGTGSGILMIAAAKLGAAHLIGIDIDQFAVEIAQKNLLLNGIEIEKFQLINGNLIDGIKSQYDFIVANILSEVILVLLDQIPQILKKDSIFICSGIIEENKLKVVEKMEALGFNIIELVTQENWVCVAGKI